MRCPPWFTTLGLALLLSAGAFTTIVSASEHDESSPTAETSTGSGSALSDAELQTKYGITPGALIREEGDAAAQDESATDAAAASQESAEDAADADQN